MKMISVNGAQLACDEMGSGRQALLLIHGHPFDRTMWQPQLEPIARLGWRVVAPDLRGYGASGGCSDKTTLEQFAGDLIALLDHLGIDRAVIAGLSLGGQIVMEICRLYPQRVRGIVLAATFPQAETPAGRRQRLATADRLLRKGMDSYAADLLPKMLSARSIEAAPEVARHVLSMMRSAPATGAAAALRGRAERPDYVGVLERLDCPALIIAGDEDAFTTREDAERMHALVKDSRLLWLSGIGHMPNLERPEAFNAALADFLGQFSRRRSSPDARGAP